MNVNQQEDVATQSDKRRALPNSAHEPVLKSMRPSGGWERTVWLLISFFTEKSLALCGADLRSQCYVDAQSGILWNILGWGVGNRNSPGRLIVSNFHSGCLRDVGSQLGREFCQVVNLLFPEGITAQYLVATKQSALLVQSL
jgi:hypothetical protein